MDSYFFNLWQCLFRIFLKSHFWNHTSEKSNHPVFINMNLVFLLASCANSLVERFPCKFMSWLWSLIGSNFVCGNEITVQSSAMVFWTVTFQTDFRKRLFRTLILKSCFQNHSDSVTLQKYQLLLNKSFKHNSTHMPSLNLTLKLSFEPKFHMFVINSYCRKSKHL